MSPTARLKERIAELTRPTGEEDLMAVDYPKPRFSLSQTAAIAAAVFALIGCVLWWALSSDELGSGKSDSEQPDFAALAAGSAAASGGNSAGDDTAGSGAAGDATARNDTTGEASAGAKTSGDGTAGPHGVEEIVVSVVGLVHNPGIMTLPEGSRAADALAVAGVLPEADLVRINHAERLSDGQQLVVLGPNDPVPLAAAPNSESSGGNGSTGTGPGANTGPIPLNTASAAELTSLHGVGEATAAAIIEFRDANGGFAAVDQLLEVPGIGPAKFSRLKDEVTV
ncbi:ComEA family DNA-binding protein [Corynebacterium pseudodiphtheriticum]|uniref:helix-hairpin-helix domain-containing protein n=1 Tax=Corynebacterium pseudodiphtheriticum TaxID=37637 RepID=UPI00047C806F|nr:ComEA family DNA-binding protein [Corynebacterium pseudodiphtheriticum]MDK4243471.1 ComEA family DNA-binding protein [Corynebacterium pseudodiphtheriticum]MDK4274225.1 ComEA family DNA-binding protein [Corynebacterium pseudodiphtheriticum]MDK4277697.1 ComEA family DNA-binding protein [Corynebacterium pseudodiphtheriticum]MDK4286782.1 ComEA family DNA-binding protein [Corynebacterium pseudodiphtheriticum]MDK4296338.1 ComEA family DNA-binding protein [Corynebacterium pseudodiphtheriticum]